MLPEEPDHTLGGDEVATRVDRNECEPLGLDRLAAPFETVDERDDAGDGVSRVAQLGGGLQRGAARRHHVFEQHDARAGREATVALEQALGAVVLGVLAHVDRVEGRAALEAGHGDGAGEWATSKLDARDGRARAERAERGEHLLADERVPLGRQDRLLAIDEEVALATRGEHHPLALERARPQKLEQPGARPFGAVHHRSALLLLRDLALGPLEHRDDRGRGAPGAGVRRAGSLGACGRRGHLGLRGRGCTRGRVRALGRVGGRDGGGAGGRLGAGAGGGRAFLAGFDVAAHEGADSDGDTGGAKVADDAGAVLEENRFVGHEIALDRAANDELAALDAGAHHAVQRERHVARHRDLAVDEALYLDVARAVDPPADARGLADDRDVGRHGQTSMSTLPLNWAPSAIVTRAAFTLPMTREPDWRSTRSDAVTLPVSDPPTTSEPPCTSASTVAPCSMVTASLAVNLPRTVPATTTSSSVEISPSMVMPAPMIVLAMVSPFQRRAEARPRDSPCEAPPSSGGNSNSQSRRPAKRAPSSIATAVPCKSPRTRALGPRRTGPVAATLPSSVPAMVTAPAPTDGLVTVAPSAMVKSPRTLTSPSTWPSMTRSPVPVMRPRTRAPREMRASDSPELRPPWTGVRG